MDESVFSYRGWRVVLACFVMAVFGYGLGFYGNGVYLAELTTGTANGGPKLTTSTVSAAMTLYHFVSALLVIFVSDAMVRLGPRLVAGMGATALTLALYLISRVSSPADLFVAYLVMSLAWAALTNAAIVNILGPWFTDKRGLAISLAISGGGIGGIFITPVLVWLNGRTPFAINMQVVAAVTFPILLIPILLWIDWPVPGLQKITNGGNNSDLNADRAAEDVTRREALETAHFWTIVGAFGLGHMAQIGFFVHQVNFFLPLIGREGAARAVFITAIMVLTGRLVLGLFVDRLDRRCTAASLFAAQALALFAIVWSPTETILYLASGVFGFSAAHIVTLPSLIIQREYPPAAFGKLSALAVALIQITFSFGPVLLGLLRDATGNYTAPLLFCVALELAGCAIVLLRIGRARTPRGRREVQLRALQGRGRENPA